MIDTSTTAGKIAVMNKSNGGENIEEMYCSSSKWVKVGLNTQGNIRWDWVHYDYRVKPQTVEDASQEYAANENKQTYNLQSSHAFLAGAQWQKDQGNDYAKRG